MLGFILGAIVASPIAFAVGKYAALSALGDAEFQARLDAIKTHKRRR